MNKREDLSSHLSTCQPALRTFWTRLAEDTCARASLAPGPACGRGRAPPPAVPPGRPSSCRRRRERTHTLRRDEEASPDFQQGRSLSGGGRGVRWHPRPSAGPDRRVCLALSGLCVLEPTERRGADCSLRSERRRGLERNVRDHNSGVRELRNYGAEALCTPAQAFPRSVVDALEADHQSCCRWPGHRMVIPKGGP